MNVVLDAVLQQIHYITVVSDRARLTSLHTLLSELKRLRDCLCNVLDPALIVTSHDTRHIYLSDDRGSTCDVSSLRLCTTHTA